MSHISHEMQKVLNRKDMREDGKDMRDDEGHEA